MSTLNYLYPGSGTVAATAAQASLASVQTVQVTFADTDTIATVVHNWGYDTVAAARGLPEVSIEPLAGSTAYPAYAITKGTNNIVISKQSTASTTGGTVQLTLNRPHSILMPNT